MPESIDNEVKRMFETHETLNNIDPLDDHIRAVMWNQAVDLVQKPDTLIGKVIRRHGRDIPGLDEEGLAALMQREGYRHMVRRDAENTYRGPIAKPSKDTAGRLKYAPTARGFESSGPKRSRD